MSTFQTISYGVDTDVPGGVLAAVATLVADGASPTQAHVTVLAAAAQALPLGSITISVDISKFTSRSAALGIINQLASLVVSTITGA